MPTVDWERIRIEYIAGGTSLRKLADKYGVSVSMVKRRATKEKWTDERTKTEPKVHQETVQKMVRRVAESNAENADIAARIRMKLLRRLEHEIDALPDTIGTESREESSTKQEGKPATRQSKAYKLRDLTAAYAELMRSDTETARAAVPDYAALDEVTYDDQ